MDLVDLNNIQSNVQQTNQSNIDGSLQRFIETMINESTWLLTPEANPFSDQNFMNPNYSQSENNKAAASHTSPENLRMQIAQQKEESRKRVEDVQSSREAGRLRQQAAQKQQAEMGGVSNGSLSPVSPAGAGYKLSTDFLGL